MFLTKRYKTVLKYDMLTIAMIYTKYIRVSNPLYSDGFSATDEDCPVYIIKGHQPKFPNYQSFLTVKIFFTLTNSADLDEMPHFAAFHLGLHYLPKYRFMGFQYIMG